MVTSSGFFYFFFFDQQTDRCVDAFAFHLWSLLLRIQSLHNNKKKEPTAETRRKEEKIVECRQVLMLSDTDVQTFFFSKKKLQGGSMEGELPVNQEMSGCVGPDGRTKKKQNFKKNFFDLLGRLLTFWVISSPFCGFFSEKLNR